jgi:hypothetical protein
MTPSDFAMTVLDPGLLLLNRVGGIWSDDRARVELVGIAGQESGITSRRQTQGTARGWFQFEKLGAVSGVLQHPLTAGPAAKVCKELSIPADPATVYEAIAWNDYLSVAFARLLLWIDPAELPAIGQQDAAWSYYLRGWRPGRPRPSEWPNNYAAAIAAIRANPVAVPTTGV